MQSHGRQVRIWMWLGFFVVFLCDYKLRKIGADFVWGVNDVKVILPRPRHYPHKHATM